MQFVLVKTEREYSPFTLSLNKRYADKNGHNSTSNGLSEKCDPLYQEKFTISYISKGPD